MSTPQPCAPCARWDQHEKCPMVAHPKAVRDVSRELVAMGDPPFTCTCHDNNHGEPVQLYMLELLEGDPS